MKKTKIFIALLLILILPVLVSCKNDGAGKELLHGDMYPEEQAFMKEVVRLYDNGTDCTDKGFVLQANYYYGQAIVGVASFRYAVSEIILAQWAKDPEKAKLKNEEAKRELEKKKREEEQKEEDDLETEDVGGLLSALNKFSEKMDLLTEKADSIENVYEAKDKADQAKAEAELIHGMWDQIAAQSPSSPYPYFFEAVLFDYRGEKEKAAEYYANALLNPNSPEKPWDFRFLVDLSQKELNALSKRLKEKEELLRQSFVPEISLRKRDFHSWDDTYLCSLAIDTLKADSTAVGAAFGLYEAALKANPFEPACFIGCAYLSAKMGNGRQAAYYINEGLLIDPGHEGLNMLLKAYKKEGGTP